MVSPLDRKLLRDLLRLRGQVLTIALVVAAGIAAFVTLRTTWASLEQSKDTYYRETAFAELFATLRRAPQSVAHRIEALPGVAVVQTRISERGMIPLPTLAEPAFGKVVSLPEHGPARLNQLTIHQGRMPTPDRPDEAVVLQSFAQAHELGPGDLLPMVINGVLRQLLVVGVAQSPEYIFPMTPGQIAPDAERFAVIWMSRTALAAAFGMSGAFNEVTLRLHRQASAAAVQYQLDQILEPYGSHGAYGRDKQISNQTLESELEQLQNLATVVPIVFLFVAAFLLNVVLSRLVLLQRSQIAMLKAVGYSNWEVGKHYLKLVLLIVGFGAALGLGLGGWLGSKMTAMYTQFFRFPLLLYRMSAPVASVAVLVSLVAGVAGAAFALRQVVRLPPAEAMRPAAPATYRPSLVERLGMRELFGLAGRMIFRELSRRPWRTGLSCLGIGAAVAIIVVGRFSYDAIEHLMHVHFPRIWKEDLTVELAEPVPARVLTQLETIRGVEHAEGLRIVGARARHGHRWRDVAITGYPNVGRLRGLLDRDGHPVPVPDNGIMLTRKLAEVLHIRVGETIEVDVQGTGRGWRPLPVAGLVDEAFGMQGHMKLSTLHRLVNEVDTINTALLDIDPQSRNAVQQRLKEMPNVVQVTRSAGIVERFSEQSGEMMAVFTLILTLFAATIAVGVVYNNARIALSMRSRDLASLRVLGFTRAEISTVLLGEVGVQVVVAIPLGLLLGTWWSHALATTIDPEMYRLPIIISERTYAFAAVVALASGAVSALLVRRRLDHLDLVSVLKTRE